MERWVLLRKGADFEAIGRRFGISPRLACLIRNREVIGENAVDRYLNGTLADLYDGKLLKGMDQAIGILKEKIEGRQKIRVIGDYDIDGVNATYILMEGLEMLGGDVDMDMGINEFSHLIIGNGDVRSMEFMEHVIVHKNKEALGQVFYRKPNMIMEDF